MKVCGEGDLLVEGGGSSRSFERSIRSILLRMSTFGCLNSGSLSRIASASSSRPLRASRSSDTTSASPAPPQADVTIARSRRRFGLKMPGVSTKTIWAAPSMAMPRTRARVVWTLRDTIETLEPTSALSRVDLPAFGAPIRATKPRASVSASSGWRHARPPSRRLPGGEGCARRPVPRSRFDAPEPNAALHRPSTDTAMRNCGA